MTLLSIPLLALLTLFTSCTHAVIPLVAKGANFVNSISGERFQIIGVAYQPGGSSGFNPGSGIDPLSDGNGCLRDAILMQRLGINTIRVYNLDPDIDHTQCASVFNSAGIYMILDVNSPLPNESLNRIAPWESYNVDYITRVFKIVEAFKNFNNTLGFFSANEIINEQSVPQVPQYVRAVTRDIKDYISKHSKRAIPVGYSAADVRPLLVDTFDYFTCNVQNSTSSKIDFFGLNSYSWCGTSSYTQSQYNVLVSTFSNTTVPIFFSEYGCIQPSPRVFAEVGAIYSNPMMGVWSGGVVYEFSQEPNNYGLVTINSNNSVSLKGDYNAFMSQTNKIDLKALVASNSTATGLNAPTCSSSLITTNLTNSFAVPARPDGFDSLINNGVSGSFPTGTVKVTTSDMPVGVYNTSGQSITGLKLNILANDQSNLPGNNTSGSSGTTTSNGGSTSPSSTNVAVRKGDLSMAMAAGVVAMGVLAHL